MFYYGALSEGFGTGQFRFGLVFLAYLIGTGKSELQVLDVIALRYSPTTYNSR